MGKSKTSSDSAKWKIVLKKEIHKRIGILRWLPHYTKVDAISDLIAGITIGLTIVPQSMAYASLARLPPEVSSPCTSGTYLPRNCGTQQLNRLDIFAGWFIFVVRRRLPVCYIRHNQTSVSRTYISDVVVNFTVYRQLSAGIYVSIFISTNILMRCRRIANGNFEIR